MQDLVAYWRDGFDWRTQEAALNSFRQFKAPLGGIDLHFIHEEGKGPNPMPLLLSHGWPGSVVEFMKVLPMLTDPARFGADPADAFTVVAPSLPGYGLSFAPGQKRFGVEAITDVFASLMTDVLAYPRFAAQAAIGAPPSRRGSPTSFPSASSASISIFWPPSAATRRCWKTPRKRRRCTSGSSSTSSRRRAGISGSRAPSPPRSRFGLTDSPAGLAAWIVEKFRTWTDCDGNVETAVTRDEMLTDITLYWATGAIGSSFWPYYHRMHSTWPIPEGAAIATPTGYAEFPKEILRPPRSVAERVYANIQRWTVMQKGGHFAALEQPEALAREVRAFFRPLR